MDSRVRNIRTLVVDDSPVARHSICSFLRMLPEVKVVGTAGDGLEAIALAMTLQPDLVLLDLQMPAMNGLEAAAHLRRTLPCAHLVMVTVHDTPGVRQACRESGAQGFVAKEHLDEELPPLLVEMFNV